ncbi:MAG: hypothetical protein ACOY94_02005 [Bacillota bacterium]
MKTFSLWLQRLCLLGFLLFAWYIHPFHHFAPIFPLAWSLVVAASAFAVPSPTSPRQGTAPGQLAGQGLLAGVLAGLAIGSADWSVQDLSLFFELCWALTPLFLFDQLFTRPWRMNGTAPSSATR